MKNTLNDFEIKKYSLLNTRVFGGESLKVRDRVSNIISKNTAFYDYISKNIDILVEIYKSEIAIEIDENELEKFKNMSDLNYLKNLQIYLNILKLIPDFKLPNLERKGFCLFLSEAQELFSKIKTIDDIKKYSNKINLVNTKIVITRCQYDQINSVESYYSICIHQLLSMFKNINNNMLNKLSKGETPKQYEYLLTDESGFEAKSSLNEILKLSSNEKKDSLNAWKQNYKLQLETIVSIVMDVRDIIYNYNIDYIGGYNPINKLKSINAKNELLSHIIEYINPKLENLSREQKRQILIGINLSVEKKILSTKLIKALSSAFLSKFILKLHRNKVRYIDLVGDISSNIIGPFIVFLVENDDTFRELYTNGDIEKIGGKKVLGFTTNNFGNKGIKENIAVINTNYSRDKLKMILDHEIRHLENQLIFIDPKRDALSSAKDEIIAFLQDGHSLDEIDEILKRLYNFFENISNELFQDKLNQIHQKDLQKAINIIKGLIDRKVTNYIDLLSIVPIREWYLLERLYNK